MRLTLREIGEAATASGLSGIAVGRALAILACGRSLDAPIIELPPSDRYPETLRDYFIAHAPAEPQSWFQPVIPAKPKDVDVSTLIRELEAVGDRALANEVSLWYHDSVSPESPPAIEIRDRWVAAQRALEEWQMARDRERFLQWPAAWADEMLKRRSP